MMTFAEVLRGLYSKALRVTLRTIELRDGTRTTIAIVEARDPIRAPLASGLRYEALTDLDITPGRVEQLLAANATDGR